MQWGGGHSDSGSACLLAGLGTLSPATFLSLQRKDKVAGNPCPICRDHKLHVDFRVRRILFPREGLEPLYVVEEIAWHSCTPFCTGFLEL